MADAAHHARRARLLTAAEEQELARTIESGRDATRRLDAGCPRPDDEHQVTLAAEARTHFMEANLGLVFTIARSFRAPAHIDRDDLVQDGMIGLERAVERFDWRKGYKFSTYATWWIRQAVQRGLENTATTVRIPIHRHNELRAALTADIEPGGTGDTSSASAQAAHLAAIGAPESLDRPIGDGATTLGEVVACGADGPDQLALGLLDRQHLHHRVGALDPISATAITQRFGLDGGEPATYAQIGADLGVSAEAARRRVQRALDRLRQDLQAPAA